MSNHFVVNSGGDPTLPPHRFAEIPGNGNYRSGRIHSYEQMKLLRDQYGIRNIVNLAADAVWSQRDSRFNCGLSQRDQTQQGNCTSKGGVRRSCPNACEPVWAADLGINYLFFPLGGRGPQAQQWSEIKSALIQGHTLIHCTAGVDRTGATVARWKRAVEGTGDAEIMSYTKSFGGAWESPRDDNRRLREWLLAGSYEAETAAAMDRAKQSDNSLAWVNVQKDTATWVGLGALWVAGGGLLWWSLRRK